MGRKLSAETKLADAIMRKGRDLDDELIQNPGTLLRLIRKRLRMTQVQLAKLSGITQTKIASIESGKHKATLTTLNRLFAAMGHQLALLPVSEATPSELIKQQARASATRNLQSIFTSMAFEDQLPSAGKMREMIDEETARLIDSQTSRIWDE